MGPERANAKRLASAGSITFDRVGKVYPDGTEAVHDLSLVVGDGEFLVFVGPSGCGKTTAMMMIAGLEEITSGQIRIGDRVINDLDPRDRDVAMVFQNYALYPHMTVYKNLAFGLEMKKVEKPEIERRVTEVATTLGLRDLLTRKPRHLSGGQRQRVAMGRAIVRDPRVFLMDEPLSNLDAKLRVQMRAEISRVQRRLRTTTIYVTHDQVEAMTMGDRVAVMRKGRLQQLDTPQRLYEEPVNLFVASFIGSPEMNLTRATLVVREGHYRLEVGDSVLSLPSSLVSERPELQEFVGRDLGVGIRPENLHDATTHQAEPGRTLQGVVQLSEMLGSDLLVYLEIQAPRLKSPDLLEVARDVDVAMVDDLITDSGASTCRFICRFGTQSMPAIGDTLMISVDVEKLHFFDLESGRAINRSEASTLAVPESCEPRVATPPDGGQL